MTELNAIKCANHLADCGLTFDGSTDTLAKFMTRRMTDRQILILNFEYLKFKDDMNGDPRQRILKECHNYIWDYDDYRQIIKMFIKREYNKRMNEEEV